MKVIVLNLITSACVYYFMTSKSFLKYFIIAHIPSCYVNEKNVKSCPCSQPEAVWWSGSVAALILTLNVG